MSDENESTVNVTGVAHTATRWEDTLGFRKDASFQSTRWTQVLRAQAGTPTEAAMALDQICRNYWYPLYAWVRRSGYSREEAEDLTQDFFARYLLEKDVLLAARQEKGKLRTFLLTVMKRFLINEWKHRSAKKRGGGQEHIPINFEEGEDRYGHEPVDHATPDEIYERQWATTLLGRVFESLRQEFATRGQEERYEALKDALWWNANESSYASLGEKLGMKENAVKQAVSRLRKQYRNLLKEEIRSTLDGPDEDAVNAELADLIAVLRRG